MWLGIGLVSSSPLGPRGFGWLCSVYVCLGAVHDIYILLLSLRKKEQKKKPFGCVFDFRLFFFLHVHTRVGGGEIRSYDLRFIRRGSQPIELSLGNIFALFACAIMSISRR
jgi:hypothetical protein